MFVGIICVISACGGDVSIVFSIVAFSVNTITQEPLHLAWWNFALTCTLTTSCIKVYYTSRSQVTGQGHAVFVCFRYTWYCLNQLAWIQKMLYRHGPRAVLSLEQGLRVINSSEVAVRGRWKPSSHKSDKNFKVTKMRSDFFVAIYSVNVEFCDIIMSTLVELYFRCILLTFILAKSSRNCLVVICYWRVVVMLYGWNQVLAVLT